MTFEHYLSVASKETTAYLHEFHTTLEKHIQQTAPQLNHVQNHFANAVGGGKGLRGMLVQLGFLLTGSATNKEIIKIGAAFEIAHASLLIHDDIIDKSFIRRGKPSVYKALGGNHYGISQAICLGDLGFFHATQVIAESNFEQSSKNQALSFFSKIISDTIIGEMLDIELAYESERWKEKDVLAIHRLKTAQYTVVGPLTIGAILGNASDILLKHIQSFGKNLGIAFQIQDDLLGVFGNPQLLGKSVTSDCKEGKNTLLISYAIKHANPIQKTKLNTFYGKGKINKKQYEEIKKIFVDTGALEYSQKQFLIYSKNAQEMIPYLTQDPSMKALFNEMIDFLIKRTV